MSLIKTHIVAYKIFIYRQKKPTGIYQFLLKKKPFPYKINKQAGILISDVFDFFHQSVETFTTEKAFLLL